MSGTSGISKKKAEVLCYELKDKTQNEIEGLVGAKFEDAALTYYQSYIDNIERRRASTHKRVHDRYSYTVTYVVDYFQGRYLEGITRKDLLDLIQHLRREGLKDSTIESNHLRFISAMYNNAEMVGLCTHKDIPNFKSIKKVLKKSKQRNRSLTTNELDRSYEYCSKSEYQERRRTGYIIAFAVETGLRKEELFSLKNEHIDLYRKIAKIVDIKDKSAERDRFIPLSELAIKQLQKQQHEFSGVKSEYAFFKGDGNRLIDCDASFNKIMGQLDIKDITFHDLRRTFGSWKLQGIRCDRLNIKQVSVRLGHKSVRQTEEAYAFLEEQGIKIEW